VYDLGRPAYEVEFGATQEDHLKPTPLERKTCKKSNSASDDRELRQRGSVQDEVPRSLAAFLAHHEAAR
jgi:hypothetical protein